VRPDVFAHYEVAMWTPVFLTAALALGQSGANLPDVAPNALPLAPTALYDDGAPAPDRLPLREGPLLLNAPPEPSSAEANPAPVELKAPLLFPPPPAPVAVPAAAAAATAAPPPVYLFMKSVQGTWEGNELIGNRMDLYGWTEGAYTAARSVGRSRGQWPMLSQSPTNASEINQNWLVFERTIVTTGTLEPTFGFHTAWILPGADARYTPSRGLLDHQQGVGDFSEYNYPIDLFHAYVEGFFPTIGRGLDVKIGKNAVPYFAETEDTVYNPLYSHSYIFYYGGPFTHTGVQTNLKLNDEWSIENRLVMGDDIVQLYGAQPTYVGALAWTQPGGGRNTALLSAVIGSGRFDYRHPYGLLNVPGQNNVNLVDLVFVHTFNPVLKYTLDAVFGYETNVQGILPSGSNNAIWYGAANYLTYTLSPRLAATARFEMFDDEEGLRTGFKGMYTAATAGVTFKPRYDVWLRPEIRYDYNGDSRPYNSNHDPQHDQLSAACDLILRW
jgi:hypothetical protein